MLRKRSMMVFGAAALVLGCGGAVDRAVAEEKAPVVFEVRADTPVVESRGGQRVIVRALVRPDGRKFDAVIAPFTMSEPYTIN